ncbi:MAG: 1-acyl-sn-glycerol-3-phosphate acyltransferase [Lachnospiraceae bacterium]|nr:1-acyl-sn-glycerol-3-phosphate acyltransferase [Lachnospiraceae bacterium]
MKIKVKEGVYAEIIRKKNKNHIKPQKPRAVVRALLRLASSFELRKLHFEYTTEGLEALKKNEPCLILMNHSSFIDLKIAATVFHDRPFNIVCTSDGFVGKEKLMRALGCIPTQKFVMDVSLVKDMVFALKKLHSSVLLYPEASYSFDGTATPLPESMGKCLKILNVPVVMIRTYGAFTRDPLYNNLQLRDVKVTAKVSYLLSPEEIKEKSADELNTILKEQFSFDNFKWQQDNEIRIDEPFRADHLNRVLYKCPHCQVEGKMEGKGITVTCKACGKVYELTEYGKMHAKEGVTEYAHIPDWYQWERLCVRKELEEGSYKLDIPVSIYMMVDTSCIYHVGEGRLKHSEAGFDLTGCEGALEYHQKPTASYSLYSDYFWYELGDMICIGDQKVLYYCFPQPGADVVAKTRLATEELYKLKTSK